MLHGMQIVWYSLCGFLWVINIYYKLFIHPRYIIIINVKTRKSQSPYLLDFLYFVVEKSVYLKILFKSKRGSNLCKVFTKTNKLSHETRKTDDRKIGSVFWHHSRSNRSLCRRLRMKVCYTIKPHWAAAHMYLPQHAIYPPTKFYWNPFRGLGVIR